MIKITLLTLSLFCGLLGFAQTLCSTLSTSMTVQQSGATVTVTNTSTVPTGPYLSNFNYIVWGDNSSTNYAVTTVTHSYTQNGTFQIRLYNYLYDSLNNTTCIDSALQYVTISGIQQSCPFYTSYTHNGQGNYTFTATSTNPNLSYTWDFGDGSPTATGNPVTHTYTSSGNFTVWATATGSGCLTNNDSLVVSIAAPTPNKIQGAITWDSTISNNHSKFKVWLINKSYDSLAQSIRLTAVDSMETYLGYGYVPYEFTNAASGDYLVKARVAPGTPNPGLVPTYHYSNAYWANATSFYHNGGSTIGKFINMILGTPPSGPGFVGGLVTQGAGKGTATGIPNLLVLLKDAQQNVMASTYTDANGAYIFQNIPVGSYTIFPEEMNYATTPSGQVNVTATSTWSNIDFEKNGDYTITPKESSSMAKIHNNKVFHVYPNPAKDLLNIAWKANTSGDAQIIISDVAGRVIMQHHALSNGLTNLDVSTLQSGVYFIKIQTANAQQTERFVIK